MNNFLEENNILEEFQALEETEAALSKIISNLRLNADENDPSVLSFL